jgi:hypothetical protein
VQDDGGIITHNPRLEREAEVPTRTIYLANGTTITAISGDYAGAAGSNHGMSFEPTPASQAGACEKN